MTGVQTCALPILIFMDGGVIVEQGPAHDVIENPQAERTRQFLARYRENQ